MPDSSAKRPVGWICAIVLTLWVDGMMWFVGDSGTVGYILSLLIPQLLLLPCGVAAFLAIRRRLWGWSTALILVTIGQVFGPMDLCLGAPSQQTADIKVLTYNIDLFQETHQGTMAEEVQRLYPDIACFQEAHPNPGFAVPAEFVRGLIGYYTVAAGGMVIASRYPISRSETYAFKTRYGTSHWNIQEAHVRTPGGEIAVFNLHMVPKSWEPDSWPKLNFVDRVERKRRLRDEELGELLRRIERIRGPLIVCGDFNQEPFSPRYRRLEAQLIDTYRATNFGFGNTINPGFPVKRLDYIWTRDLIPLRSDVLNLRFSDHMPVMSEFKVPTD